MKPEDLTIKDVIRHDPKVGTQSCHSFGILGSGKSNQATGIQLQNLKRKEFLIMPADVMCEWRHIVKHKKLFRDNNFDYKILIPQNSKIFYHGFKRNKNILDVDMETVNVTDYLSSENPLVAIYLEHYPRSDRTHFWAKFLKQTIRRTNHVDLAINFLFHEAGILFPESAQSEHWKTVKEFSEAFVETRKAYVRCFFISQLEAEIESTIRKKCAYKIIRQGRLSRAYDKNLRASTPYTGINQYHLDLCGLYKKNNEVLKVQEYKKFWKMIPQSDIARSQASVSLEKEPKTRSFVRNGKIFLQETDEKGRFAGKPREIGSINDFSEELV